MARFKVTRVRSHRSKGLNSAFNQISGSRRKDRRYSGLKTLYATGVRHEIYSNKKK